MITCQHCGFDNPGQAAVCTQCGQALPVRCDACGAENHPSHRFCSSCGHRLAAARREVETAAEALAESRPAASPKDEGRAERRQLTVMFCDLVGSTALSLELDPEDLREVVRSYQHVCAEVVARFDGYIAQYLGDGILIYFGYPRAYEDAAERAVYAGLKMLRSIDVLSRKLRKEKHIDLAVRIGVHTGIVVVGEVGGGGYREQLAMGEVPNLAARLQGLAGANELVISGATYRLVASTFECDNLGPQSLKGFLRAEPAFRVLGEREVSSPLELADVHSTALLGREADLERLLARWSLVQQGKGQVATVTGEAGIGKSHLVHAFKQHLAGAPHVRLESRCSPYYQCCAFYPVVELLQRMLNFYPEQSAAERLDTLVFMLERNDFDLPAAVPLFAALLGVPLDERFSMPDYSPQLQRKHTQVLLWKLLENLAQEEPLLLIVEDLHWVDPSTLALFEQFVGRVASLPVLVLFTSRPTFRVPWPARENQLPIVLERLSRRQVEQLMLEVSGGRALPGPIVEQIVRKTDGVPLFVQELTKMVLESGVLVEQGTRLELDGSLPPLSIPATLQDSLMARLDRLSRVKEVVQVSAALGREFSYELLRAVSDIEERTLQDALAQLVEAELLLVQGRPPQAQYQFRHVLLQEAAYESMLRSQRQRLHRRIAAVLEAQFQDADQGRPELLAHHYTRAGLNEQAARFWNEAGQRALGQSANQEALDYFRKGMALLEGLPETPERLRLRLVLQAGRASALLLLKGYTHPDVGEAFERARLLCQRVGEAPELIQVLYGLHMHYDAKGEHLTAGDLAQQMLQVAQRSGDEAMMLEAKRCIGRTLFWRGEVEAAYTFLKQVLTDFEAVRPSTAPSLAARYPYVGCLSYQSLVLWHCGRPTEAVARADEAIGLARQLRHPFSEVVALGLKALLLCDLRDRSGARAHFETMLELANQHEFSFWQGAGAIMLPWTRLEEDPEANLSAMEQKLAALQQAGVRIWVTHPMMLLAQALGERGQTGKAVGLIEDALAIAERTHEHIYLPELHRVRGELLLPLGRTAEAEACFRSALTLAQHQKSRPLILRALLSLLRLNPQEEAPQALKSGLQTACADLGESSPLPEWVEARTLLSAYA